MLAAEKYESSEPLNLGSGKEISIKELVEIIQNLMGIKLEIDWKTTKLNGQPRRCVDSSKVLNKFGSIPEISLEIGLKETIEWFEVKMRENI